MGDDLFRLSQKYRPQQVAIEVTGQQGGFISWIQREQLNRNQYFTMASENNSGKPGIRPNTNKMVRFNVILPMFKMNKIFFPEERKESPEMIECMGELSLAAKGGFKSKHDDFIDTISMLSSLSPWRPTQEADLSKKDYTGIWDIEEEDAIKNDLESYIV